MQQKLKNNKGFTIIEVMIVLAIAGLIMLIVFLAVPALQRSARNTSRKEDAGRLASAVSTFVSNANGNLPGFGNSTTNFSTSQAATDGQVILSDAGKLGQLSLNTAAGSTTGDPKPGTLVIANTVPSPAPTWQDNEVVVYVGYTCQGSWVTTGGTIRQAALVYPIEGSSNYSTSCIDAL